MFSFMTAGDCGTIGEDKHRAWKKKGAPKKCGDCEGGAGGTDYRARNQSRSANSRDEPWKTLTYL